MRCAENGRSSNCGRGWSWRARTLLKDSKPKTHVSWGLLIVCSLLLPLLVLPQAAFPRGASATAATDDFNRADGGLGANWTAISDGGLSIASQAAAGSSGGIAGDIRTGETYASDQYSQIEVTATQLSGGQWIGPAVRTQNGGARLGLLGIPKAAETVMLERDFRLVALSGGRYHAASITCAESLEVLRRAKDAGLDVTASCSINHITLNENDIGAYRTFLKLSPPLRAEGDRKLLVEALASGLLDMVMVGRQSPQDVEDQAPAFRGSGAWRDRAGDHAQRRLAPGADSGEVTIVTDLAAARCRPRPADLLGLPRPAPLKSGAPADVIVVDTEMPWGARRGRAQIEMQEHAVR